MSSPISGRRLNDILEETLVKINISYGESPLYLFFLLLYGSGARYSDAIRFMDWEITANSYIYTGQKNGRIVSLPISFLDERLADIYNNSVGFSFDLSYQSVLNAYYRMCNSSLTVGGGKLLGLHSFRHNKAKILYINGYTIRDIQNILGDAGNTIIEAYVGSTIWEV